MRRETRQKVLTYFTLNKVLGTSERAKSSFIFSRSYQTFYPTLAAIVLGRNVANTKEIEDYINGIETGDKRVDQWLKQTLRKYLIRDYEQVAPVNKAEENSPEWLKKSLEKGDKVVQVRLDNTFKDKIQHIIDYLKSQDAPQNLDRLTVPEALKQSDAWTQQLVKKKVDQDVALQGEDILKTYPDGYSWRELTSEASLALEGKKMGHCVGSYWSSVQSGKTRIDSLRDPQNEPHCTIEIRMGKIEQIKGKGNKAVVEQYRHYVKDFLNDGDLAGDEKVSTRDLQNAGLVEMDGTVYDLEEIKKNPKILEDISPDTIESHSEELGSVGFIVLDGKAYTSAEVREDAALTKKLIQRVGGITLSDETEVRHDEDDGSIEVGCKWMDAAIDMLPLRGKDADELKGLLDDTYNVEFRVKDESSAISGLYDHLKEKGPATYKKLMDELKRVATASDDDREDRYDSYSWCGEFLSEHEEELPEIYQAVLTALNDGWEVGTQDKAHQYVKNLLGEFEWEYASTSEDSDGTVWLKLTPEALSRGEVGDIVKDPMSRRGGFDYDFSEDAAKGRFLEALHEENYLVKEPEKKKAPKKKPKKK
jgi:hypothetical protein